jgi:hypothetical protein
MSTPHEAQIPWMHESVLQILSRGIERTTRFPQNGYRRRLYFEGLARLGEDLTLIAAAAAALTRINGSDLMPD